MSNSFYTGLEQHFSAVELEKIRGVRIGIAGAGGLGSNCAMHLVRCGFSQFVIADHDQLEPANLNRQFFFLEQIGEAKVTALGNNLKKINPDITITAYCLRVRQINIERIFGGCDIIVEAFDEPAAKSLLVEHFINSGKLVVAASGIAGCGDSDSMTTKRMGDDLYIVGDFVSESSAALPPYSPKVAIAAAKQADIILARTLEKEAV